MSAQPELMQQWLSFYAKLGASGLNTSGNGTRMYARGGLGTAVSDTEDEILGALWAAHTASIHVGLSLFADESALLAPPEQKCAHHDHRD